MKVTHTFEPIYNEQSKILILGTFPSVKSRESAFYYGHPQNRFWKVLACLTEEKVPETMEEKKGLLLTHGIAIWDVIASCDIQGSSDSSIKDVIPNDIAGLLRKSKIQKIYGNGDKACQLYNRFCREQTGMEICKLPSTSPANAAFSLDKLIVYWKKEIDIKQLCKEPSNEEEQ